MQVKHTMEEQGRSCHSSENHSSGKLCEPFVMQPKTRYRFPPGHWLCHYVTTACHSRHASPSIHMLSQHCFSVDFPSSRSLASLPVWLNYSQTLSFAGDLSLACADKEPCLGFHFYTMKIIAIYEVFGLWQLLRYHNNSSNNNDNTNNTAATVS